MKIGTLVRSYGLTKYLRAVLKSYDWVDRILVVNYRFKNVKPREDKTKEIIEELGQKNIEVITGIDYGLHQAINYGISKLQDCERIFIADSDELITRGDQQRLLKEFRESGARCPLIEYARDYDHIFPIRGHKAITLVKPDVHFYDVRCASGAFPESEVYIHHFGYTFNPEEMGWKIDWERPWEHDETIRIYSQIPKLYTMPEEIKEMLNA